MSNRFTPFGFFCSQNFKIIWVSNPSILSVTWWWLFQKRTWWWLFQKRAVRTKFDIYVFIKNHKTSIYPRKLKKKSINLHLELIYHQMSFLWSLTSCRHRRYGYHLLRTIHLKLGHKWGIDHNKLYRQAQAEKEAIYT